MNTHTSIYTVAFALVVGIGCVAEQAPAPTADGSTNLEIELAQPQPQIPLCSRCNIGKGGGYTAGDDELSMDIDNSYNGYVTGVSLTTWDSAGTPSYHSFDSSVISDINDPYTEITLVYIEAPTAASAQLTWTHTGGTQINTLSVY